MEAKPAHEVSAQIRERLIHDLKDDNFVLYFQSIVPVIASATEPLHREILVRFKEEEDDLIAPGSFLPVLEEHGLTALLDRWVVAQILKWTRGKQVSDTSRKVPRSGINLSSDTLRRDPAFADFVVNGLRKTEVTGACLMFELPVAEVLAAGESISRLTAPLRAAGCSLALNDFVGQPGGFELAEKLGFNFIKIDGSLIDRITRDAHTMARVIAMQERCRKLGLRTICMQVESPDTLEALRTIRADYAQGFGIDRPRLLQ
ncbi:MAG TPA: EAL domain-containing protein [Usitatibacter sp.]|nr:EAL domain-containing protein [Usitatibacter sp.]